MKNKKYTIRKKIHYVLDDYISKGFIAQLVLLLAVAGTLVLIFGLILTLYGEEQYLSDAVWESLMHMIDQGTITGEDKESDNFLQIMLILTFIGMAFTSTIIALISSSIQEKMYDLRKGHSAIIEKDHVVIMGFNENTYTISREIAENGMRTRIRDCVVIVDDLQKEDMEHDVKDFQQSRQQFFEQSEEEKRRLRKSKLIFRSGDLISDNTFEMCAVERARAIIINRENDLETVKILLALVSYLKRNKSYISDDYMPSVVAMIYDEENLIAAKTAAGILRGKETAVKQKNENKIRILYYKDIFASLFAQACINPGLPYVLDSLFNSHAASICIEKKEEDENGDSRFVSKNLSEISRMISGAIPIGYARTDANRQVRVVLNPKEDDRFKKGDKLIYLSHYDDLRYSEEKEDITPVGTPVSEMKAPEKALRRFLLVGSSDEIPRLVTRMKEYCLEGSSVAVISDESASAVNTGSFSLKCAVYDCAEPYRFSRLQTVLDAHPEWFDGNSPEHLTNIVILSGGDKDKAKADEKVTVLLLNIRRYLQEKNDANVSITSEMYLPKDQTLLQNNSSNDFVVASEISNRMMVQISGDPRKYYVTEDLLRQRSGSVRLKRVSGYVDVTEKYNFEAVFREVRNRTAAGGKREIPLGWVRLPDDGGSGEENCTPMIVLAPNAEQRARIVEENGQEHYRLVVMVEGMEGE